MGEIHWNGGKYTEMGANHQLPTIFEMESFFRGDKNYIHTKNYVQTAFVTQKPTHIFLHKLSHYALYNRHSEFMIKTVIKQTVQNCYFLNKIVCIIWQWTVLLTIVELRVLWAVILILKKRTEQWTFLQLSINKHSIDSHNYRCSLKRRCNRLVWA